MALDTSDNILQTTDANAFAFCRSTFDSPSSFENHSWFNSKGYFFESLYTIRRYIYINYYIILYINQIKLYQFENRIKKRKYNRIINDSSLVYNTSTNCLSDWPSKIVSTPSVLRAAKLRHCSKPRLTKRSVVIFLNNGSTRKQYVSGIIFWIIFSFIENQIKFLLLRSTIIQTRSNK